MSLHLPDDDTSGPFSGDKILWHLQSLNDLKEGKIPPPISIEFDLSNVCNLDCPYCTNAAYRQQCNVMMDFTVAEKVIDELAAIGVKSVTFTGGGEPTLHPQYESLLRLAKKSGLEVALITNGLRTLSPEVIFTTCTWVRFSVDAYDRDTYLRSKRVDGFTKVCRNIKALAEARQHYPTATTTLGIGVLTEAVGHGNLAKTVEMLEPLGVDYIQFRPMTFSAQDERSQTHVMEWDEEDYQQARAKGTDKFRVFISAAKYRHRLQDAAQRNYKHCTGVFVACVIGATGDVWICCHMRGNPRFSIGNIHERPFTEIWHDSATRNAIHARIGNFEECMPLCRFHGQNTLLGHINWHPQHVNFL